MRLRLALLIVSIICVSGAWGDAVSVMQQDGEWLVSGASYEATVGADGALTSMRVKQAEGEPLEFLVCNTSAPRGLYTYLAGWLPLGDVQQPEPNVVTASAEKARVRYEFGEDAVTVTLENLADEQMSLLGIFAVEVNTISDDFGFFYALPMKGAWNQTAWYREGAKLAMEGRASVWGPWSEGYTVWQLKLNAGASATVTLRPGIQDEQEAEQVAKALAGNQEKPTEPEGPMWDMELLSRVPQTWPSETHLEEGVDTIFYEGRPFRGRPTRVFAYMGVPEVAPGEKVPAMVLVHGGGGTAYAEWVRMWNERGYAAISMDTCGNLPEGQAADRPRHEFSGPPGWGGWGQTDWPREDQWTYHAVADALLANSLLRSLPEVDPERIGVTGISWGGYLTSLIAGVDARLKLAMPVYGCGYYLDTHFATPVKAEGEEGADRWMRWWDPSAYLKDAAMPMMWVTGTNDFAYWLPGLQKSYRDPIGPRTLCVTLRMPHGHGSGWALEELYAYADSILKDGTALPRITGQGRDGDEVWVDFESPTAIEKAELLYTKDTNDEWPEREWFAQPAELGDGKASATLPEGTSVYFINIVDERGLTVSGEHGEIEG